MSPHSFTSDGGMLIDIRHDEAIRAFHKLSYRKAVEEIERAKKANASLNACGINPNDHDIIDVPCLPLEPSPVRPSFFRRFLDAVLR